MDIVPPSYQSATTRDAWSIIARYIPSSDLCAAALVCQRWHKLFMPFLWGDPASHFGTDNDAVYGKNRQNSRVHSIPQLSLISTINYSRSYEIQEDFEVCKTCSAHVNTYPSPSSGPV